MSAATETTLREAAGAEIEALGDKLAEQFAPAFKSVLQVAPPEVVARVKAALARAAKLRWKAAVEKDPTKAREYAAGVETAMKAVRVMLTGEALVKSNEVADAIMAGIKTTLDFMVEAGAKLMGVALQQLAAGAVQGLVGGAGGGGSGGLPGFPR